MSSLTTDLMLTHRHLNDRGQVAATIDEILNTHKLFSTRHRIIDTSENVDNVIVIADQLFDDRGATIGTYDFYIDVSALPEQVHEGIVIARLAKSTENRAGIEQTKSMLMLIDGITYDTPFNLLKYAVPGNQHQAAAG
ncbi:hypothetical protein JK2ML_1796 [Mycobacterium leprae Kyoto-2]|uniref:hypothetical protein n=1 Tax=Mycobacterium leprae TaxID=1769 RepID=UPI000E692CDA|nr:hypothetical protein [Mycobacterium leprae]BBC17383.1 hypothetical protein JK2ML_1796 [Mycobacterium leprae Kyoto-2]